MAVKGRGYTKTTWILEERPVTSSKLNSWDDRIEAALELVHYLLSQAWGGGDGVLRGATDHDLDTHATDPTSLSVIVEPGYAFIARFAFKLDEAVRTAAVVAPTAHPRIDLVQARLTGWDVIVRTGQETPSPSVPAPDTVCIALAELHLRPGMTCIKDENDGTNGYVVNARRFL